MSKSNNIVDKLAEIYMESIQPDKTINEQSGAKVYALVYQHDIGELVIYGIYSTPQAAQEALEEENAPTRNRPGEGLKYNLSYGDPNFSIRVLPLDQISNINFVNNARKVKVKPRA